MCKECLDWMESEVKSNDTLWSKRLLPGKKAPVVETVKKVLIPAKKEEVK